MLWFNDTFSWLSTYYCLITVIFFFVQLPILRVSFSMVVGMVLVGAVYVAMGYVAVVACWFMQYLCTVKF